MRTISIEVDCGRVRCKGCGHCVVVGCNLFDRALGQDGKFRPLRCDECLNSEIAGTVHIEVAGMPVGNYEVTP